MFYAENECYCIYSSLVDTTHPGSHAKFHVIGSPGHGSQSIAQGWHFEKAKHADMP
jgi:hypothetical protein